MERLLELEILPQPDDTTCGPTSLHAVYAYYGDDISLGQVIEEVVPLETGGTLGVLLGCHALRRGYRAIMHPYNLQVFDPSWFKGKGADIDAKLREQMEVKHDEKLHIASKAYLDYIELGGELVYRHLEPSIIRHYLNRSLPILTGLSATYLYDSAREHDNKDNDILGEPSGHFVVLCGYDAKHREVLVADPLADNPHSSTHYYPVRIDRLICSILLGIVTYDANLLVIEPRSDRAGRSASSKSART